MALVIAVMLCLHDPAIVQQTESKTAKQQNSHGLIPKWYKRK